MVKAHTSMMLLASLICGAFGFSSIPAGGECKDRDPMMPNDDPSNIFDPPTADEMSAIYEALAMYDFGNGVELSKPPLAGPDADAIKELFGDKSLATTQLTSPGPIWGGIMKSYISRIELYAPPKAEAVAYVWGDSTTAPGRYAQVNVAFGSLPEPYFSEYKVGPLDAAPADMTVEKLTDQLWGSRSREGNEMRALKTMVDMILREPDFETLCKESFAGKLHGLGLNNHEPGPPGLIGAERKTPILVNFHIEGTWRGKDLHLVPLSWTIDNTAQDPSMWTAYDFYYNMQGPYTRDELIAAYMSDNLTKVTIPESYYDEIQKSAFPAKRPELPDREYAELSGPHAYMPSGVRYNVKGRTIEWMGWKLHVGYDFRAGPDFHAISFKGESVAYQVAINEIGLIYAANDPVAGNVHFLDSNFGNGEYRELMRGIDCPDYATYLTNYWWAAPGGPVSALRSTCVYEHHDGGVLWRRGGPFVSGLHHYDLNVKMVMPNGNYDYIITYKFALDGRMRVDLGSSGFIQTHFWSTSRGPYNSQAYKLHTYSGGSLHDHTFGFKVDVDVGSQTNSLETVAYKMGPTLTAINAGLPEDEKYTEVPLWLKAGTMRYTEHAIIGNEDEAQLNIDPQQPKSWLFGDQTLKNKWGNTRNYKLYLDQNPAAGVDPSHYSMPGFSYANNMLSVTKYKDTERMITGAYDLNRIDDPQGSFQRYVDGESIEQEDIVAWITMTALHLPISEDYPMTNVIRHGFSLSPWNFFDENAAMDLPHFLRMNPAELPDDTRTADQSPIPYCVPIKYDTTHEFSGA